MAPPDLTSGPGRMAAVFGPPGEPAAGLRAGATPAGWLGPGGVWPPPPQAPPVARAPADDPPTVPLLLASAEFVVPPSSGRPAHGRPGQGGRLPALLRRLVPHAWRGARVDPGRRGATALVLVAAGAAVVAAVGVWTERPRADPVPALPGLAVVTEPSARADAGAVAATTAAPAPETTTETTAAEPGAPLVVSVSGKVHRPGLVEVPDGARVADVLDAAGGALPGTDLAGLNLARRVDDGEQVAVGVPAAPDAAAPAGPAADPAAGPSAPAGRLNLNTATAAELDVLPGVGPVMATRILEWRSRNGRFARVEQLREIEGIGERRFGQLRELVTV